VCREAVTTHPVRRATMINQIYLPRAWHLSLSPTLRLPPSAAFTHIHHHFYPSSLTHPSSTLDPTHTLTRSQTRQRERERERERHRGKTGREQLVCSAAVLSEKVRHESRLELHHPLAPFLHISSPLITLTPPPSCPPRRIIHPTRRRARTLPPLSNNHNNNNSSSSSSSFPIPI